MSVIVGHPSIVILGSTLISLLASYTNADDFISSVGRTYSDIDIRFLTIVGSFAIAFFLERLFDAAIAFLLRMIGYSTRLILELETDETSYEDGVDDQLSDYNLITTNCLDLWR